MILNGEDLDSNSATISDVQIVVTGGKTQAKTIKKWIDVADGQDYPNIQTLKDQVEKDKQTLLNLRVFESVETILEPMGIIDGKKQWRVLFNIKDGLSFVPIPLVLYDSNVGVQVLYIQIWDNVAGSLNKWFSLISFSFEERDDGEIKLGPWKILPKLYNIKIGDQIFGFQLEQEYAEKRREDNNIVTADYSFYRSEFAVSTEFPFGPEGNWTYTLEPGIEMRYGYITNSGPDKLNQTTFSPLVKQSLFFDNVNFIGNARSGLKAGITNNLRLDIQEDNTNFIADISGEIIPYFNYKRLSYYARLSGIYIFNDEYEDMGEPLRGIPNDTMYGFAAIYLNQTIGIDVIPWKGILDLQIHPFYDVGFVVNSKMDQLLLTDIRHALGADILLFIDKVPNLSFRFSWGFDLDPYLSWEEANKTEFIVRYSFSY